MPAIHLNNLSFRYSTASDVLTDVDINLGPGWTGVVGANGAGKTTLLHIVADRLTPGAGSVNLDPSGALVVLCDQTVESRSSDIDAFGESWEGLAASLRGRLHLDPVELERWPTLSPGERKRWQIGSALSREPDVLLLDEPTNHLDLDARYLLVGALRRFGGVGLVVSHDRALLEDLTIRTLRIHNSEATLWNGSYGDASAGWLAVESAAMEAMSRLKAEARKAERHRIDLRQVNEQKRAQFKRRNNTSSFKDIDSRSAARQARHQDGDKAAGKRLSAAAAASQRAADVVAANEMRRTIGGEIAFDAQPAPKRLVASHNGPLRAGNHTIVEHLDLGIERTDRIWLRGPNGIGKSTLLRSLTNSAGLPPDRLLFLEQEMTPERVDEVVADLHSLPADQRGSVLAIVALLGVDPDVLLASNRPSPGEARKLAMALGLGRSAALVALDEPTNHLDLPSIERLQRALAEFPGALIVVTHDEEFAKSLDLEPFDMVSR